VPPLLPRNREASRPSLPPVDLVFVVGAIIYFGIAFVAEITIWNDRPPTIILAVPVIVSAIWKSPREVIILAAMSVLVAAADVMIDTPPADATLVSFLALVAITFGAAFLSLERYALIERRRRTAEAIRHVQDLRQPLTVIIGYAQALRSRSDLPACIQKSLDRIIDAGTKLNRLIAEALDRDLGASP
jgi:signal transduction histidine kinase